MTDENDLPRAVEAVLNGRLPPKPVSPAEGRFGKLTPLSTAEREQLVRLRRMITGYVLQETHKHPLCLAIFGAPGSGKSFAARQIADRSRLAIPRLSAPACHAATSSGRAFEPRILDELKPLNLTQIPDARALAKELGKLRKKQEKDRARDGALHTPVVFFDEFDAPHDGAPYGWLPWFLAPMNDGELHVNGETVELKRAVYLFAGGTAATMGEFSGRRHLMDFRQAKGPDFVSRLRGSLDVVGPNTEPRVWRRAAVLIHELSERAKALGVPSIAPDREIVEAMLQVGRYVHGARSIAAILEMSAIPRAKPGAAPPLSFAHLPAKLTEHADRGPLDPEVIGGYVALSGYAEDEKVAKRTTDAWLAVARKLWSEGATLAYGGALGKKLTDALNEDLKRWRHPLTRTGKDEGPVRLRAGKPVLGSDGKVERLPPNPRLWQFQPIGGLDEKEGAGVHNEPQPASSDTERAFLKERPADLDRAWVLEAIRRFRRRLDVSERSVARFLVCGKGVGYNGRFSGIAEEAMLTLVLGRPVYVAGGFGGAAQELGALLGLARPWTGEKLGVFEPVLSEARLALLERFSEPMRPPGLEGLPLTQEALVSFLREHCIDGPRWPDNGLDKRENRELFQCDDGDRIAELVLKGLTRRFARQ